MINLLHTTLNMPVEYSNFISWNSTTCS